MNSIRSSAELKSAILRLQNQQEVQGAILKEQFHHVVDNLKPANIIKNTIREAMRTPGTGQDIIEYIADWVGDFIANKFKGANPDSFFLKYFGKLLHYGVSAIITMNSETILSWASRLFEKLFGNKKQPEEAKNETHNN